MNADPVLTLADLESWSRNGVALAVLGHPIAHSLSPAMHNAALKHLAQRDAHFRDWRYFRFDVPPAELPRALALLNQKKFRGLNLTVPHKVIAFEHLAKIDDAARPIGAVNTLVHAPHGWRGHNTDGYGLAAAIHETLGLDLRGTPIVLLGAGGAARGAAVECLQQGCASLWIGNRTRENLGTLLDLLRPLAGKIAGFALASPPADLPTNTLVINATSLGLKRNDAAPIDLRHLPRPAGVFDMIYNPPKTALLAQARALKIPCANGLAMLVHQGAKSLELWTGAPAAETVPIMLAAAEAAQRGV